MKDDETIRSMFSRFLTFVVGLKVLNKGYTIADYVKIFIKSLQRKWRPVVTAPKGVKES